MKPILFPSLATSFNNRGLGALSDAISCVVREERNGEYELTMQYPMGGIHFDEIQDRAIIYAIPSPYRTPQPFRIYSIESPLNGIVTIHAHHISYDLSGIPVSPFTAGSCSQALNGLVTNSVVTNPFSVWTDKLVTSTYKLSVPTSFRACLGGQEGSILDVYGKGEYEFDKYDVKLFLNRGSDNGVKIAYGKNLTDFNMERNLENLITGVYPYWANLDENEIVELDGKIITIYDPDNPSYLIDSGGNYLIDSDGKYLLVMNPFPFDNVLPLDLSSDFETKPTQKELKERAEKYIIENGLGAPRVSIEVSFVQLEQTEEYKDLANLEAVDLCDTVTVEFPMYGISAKAKIIAVETDVLLERYTSVQIGDAKPSLADTIAHLEVNSVTKNEVKVVNQKAADYINNTVGTFEWIDNGDGTNGGFTIYEHDDTTSWLRCTAGGIGISDDGGLTYTNAITKDGVIASRINVTQNGVAVLSSYYDADNDSVIAFRARDSHFNRNTIIGWSRRTYSSVAGTYRGDTYLNLYDAKSGNVCIGLGAGYWEDDNLAPPSTSIRLYDPLSGFAKITIESYGTNTKREARLAIFNKNDSNEERFGIYSSGNNTPYMTAYDSTNDVLRTLSLRAITISGTTYYVFAGT